MIDRHADRLMVAYLYLELGAMCGTEDKSTSAAPLHGVRANRRNHVRLAAATMGGKEMANTTAALYANYKKADGKWTMGKPAVKGPSEAALGRGGRQGGAPPGSPLQGVLVRQRQEAIRGCRSGS